MCLGTDVGHSWAERWTALACRSTDGVKCGCVREPVCQGPDPWCTLCASVWSSSRSMAQLVLPSCDLVVSCPFCCIHQLLCHSSLKHLLSCSLTQKFLQPELNSSHLRVHSGVHAHVPSSAQSLACQGCPVTSGGEELGLGECLSSHRDSRLPPQPTTQQYLRRPESQFCT